MGFKVGDIVETVGRENSWVAGTLAKVMNGNVSDYGTIQVQWIRTHPDGSDVLDKYGEPLEQRNGGYFPRHFKLSQPYGKPRKYLKKLVL